MKWLIFDLVAVSVFTALGRVSHDEGLTLLGWWHTTWPFLTGAALGWALVLLRRLRGPELVAGLQIWLAAVATGMLLRMVTGAGTAPSFVVVATVVLGTFLMIPRVGHRLLNRTATGPLPPAER